MTTLSELSRKRGFYPLTILLIVVLIVVYLISSKPKPPTTESEEKSWLVSYETITLGSASPQLSLLGTIESPFDATLSAAITADVARVPVREGQYVEAGQVLVELDPREIQLQVQEKQADVLDIEAQIAAEKVRYQADQKALADEQKLLGIADKSVSRQQRLRDSNLVAQEGFEAAESIRAQRALSITTREQNIADHPNRLRQLQARLSKAKTALSNAEIDADRASIRAPFDGVVTSVTVSPGERVQIGQALVSLYDQEGMEVRAQIPDRYVSLIRQALRQGQVIDARASAFGTETPLKLERLSGQANRGAGGVDALLIPIEEDSQLILNGTVKLYVDLPKVDQVVTLPVSALYGADRIYRIEDGRLHALKIRNIGKIFREDQLDRIIIAADELQTGDRIITTQLPNAITGLKVTTRSAQDDTEGQ